MRLGIFGRSERPECRAIARGASRLGWDVVWQRPEVWSPDQFQPFDLIATFGLRLHSGAAARHYESAGIGCIAIDLPALRLDGYYALWPGRINAIPASARIDRLGPVCFKNVPLGDGVLVCGQTGGDVAHEMDARDMRRWAREAVESVRAACPGRRIVWRPHPQFVFYAEGAEAENPTSRSLEGSLCSGEFGAVVTHNSTCGVRALQYGIPTYCADDCFYKPIAQAGRYPSDAEPAMRPNETKRRRFFARIMYSQWTLEEIETGEPIALTLERLPKLETHPDEVEAIGAYC